MQHLKPLVIVLEDLHWSDRTSIEFLESLYRLAEENRILFINVFRPGYLETGDRILKTTHERYGKIQTSIILESLPDGVSGELINNLIKN